MDQIDVATFVTALLILFFFFQARQFLSPGHEQGSEKNPPCWLENERFDSFDF